MAALSDQDFSMTEGDDFVLQVTVRDAAGLPVNLTGILACRWEFALYAGATPLVQKAIGTGVTLVTPASGRVDVAIVPADTNNRAGTFRHEMQITDATGKILTVLVGDMVVSRDLIS